MFGPNKFVSGGIIIVQSCNWEFLYLCGFTNSSFICTWDEDRWSGSVGVVRWGQVKWFSWRCSANNLNVSGNNALIVSYRGISWAHEMPLTGKGGVVRETKIIMVPTLTYGSRWVHYRSSRNFYHRPQIEKTGSIMGYFRNLGYFRNFPWGLI